MDKQDGVHMYKGIFYCVLRLVPKSTLTFLQPQGPCSLSE